MSATLPPERSFGFLMAAAFALLAGWLTWRAGVTWAGGAAATAALAFLAIALARPHLLAPLNRAWFALGQLLGKVVNPVVLGAMFFLILTPVALLTRAFGRDELRLRRRPPGSLWRDRSPPGPAADSFKNQF